MRMTSFRCRTCLNEKLQQEAEKAGCKVVGPGSVSRHRTYLLSCGHKQDITISSVRRGTVRCPTCLDDKLKQEAKAQGCELLGPGRHAAYRTYRLPCGHESEYTTGAIRKGGFRCQTCLDDNLSQEAKAQGCELIGPGRDKSFRIYRLPCGHEQESHVGSMRIGIFRCQTCLDNKLEQEAQALDCELLGPGRHYSYRSYRLSCGHTQEVQTGAMRNGIFRCSTCDSWARTQPSNVYLLRIKVNDQEWLKLGYAKNIDLRTSQYGLPEDAEVELVGAIETQTGANAHAMEVILHAEYREHRLPARRMKKYHSNNGHTECYPVELLPKLANEIGL